MRKIYSYPFLFIGIVLFLFSSIEISAQTTFSPNNISGLKLWLRGDSVQTTSPPFVDKCFDNSATLNDANQLTVGQQPTLINAEFNGHDIIRFDGVDDYLQFNAISDIRTVFWIVREDVLAIHKYRSLLGHSSTYNFVRGDNKEIWNSGLSSPSITGGVTKLNSTVIDGTTTLLPTVFSMLSLVTTGDVEADNFSNDRISPRVFQGDLAELIIYNKALSVLEVDSVELYLRNKYAPPVDLGADITVATGFCNTTLDAGSNFTSYTWSTGASTQTIAINKSDEYWVEAVDIFGFTSRDTVQVTYPSANFVGDSLLCSGDTKVWNTFLSKSDYTFLWQDNSTDSLINITAAGQYYVQVTDASSCVTVSDTLEVTIDNFTAIATLGNDVTICSGNAIALATGSSSAATYIWSDGSTNDSLIVLLPGPYSVTVTSTGGCIKQDDINIAIMGTAPTVNFSISTNFCIDSLIQFNDVSFIPPGDIVTSRIWDFGDLSSVTGNAFQTHKYADIGGYTIKLTIATNVGCSSELSKQVVINDSCLFKPSNISGLKLWLTGDSVQFGVTPNVSTCFDLSTATNHATQVIAGQQPTLINSAFNGHDIIRFDGVDDYLQFNAISDIRTVFWIVREDVLATNKYRSLLGHSSTYNFVRGDNKEIWNSGLSSPSITGGVTKLNSTVIDGTTTLLPTSFSMISLVTTGDVEADNFSNDRISPRVFQGDLAELIIYNKALSVLEVDSVELYLRNKYAPPVDLGADITVAVGFCNTTLDAGSNFTSYTWSTGASTQTIAINKSDEYWVEAVDIFGFTSRDTVQVTYPSANFVGDSLLCSGDTKVWNTFLSKSDYTFLWQDNSTDSLINITAAGQYYVQVTDVSSCVTVSDTLEVIVDNFPTIASLGPDTTLCIGNSLYLKSGAAQAVSYTWSDGSTNDSLLITIAGQYSVTASSINGCIKNDVINITIAGSAPTVAFSISTTCEGSATVFTDASSPPAGNSIVSQDWDFGDLALGSGTPVSHTYADSGSYTAKLTITTNVGCTAELSKTFTVYPYPLANFTSSNLCERDSVLFTGSATDYGYPITQWGWSFGEPTAGPGFESMLQDPKHYYANAATYTVSLTIQNAYGCSDTINNPITLKQSPVTDFNYSLLCEKESISFTDNTSATIALSGGSWDFGDGSAVSPLINPTHTYSVSGTYSISHTMTYTNTCSNTMTKVLTVNPKPTALYATGNVCVSAPINFTDTSLISSGTITAWLWTFGAGGPTSTLQNPQYTFNTPVSPQIKLKVTSDSGCVDSITKTVIVHPLPVADFTYSPTNGSPPLAVTFTNTSTGAITYAWDFGDTNTDTQTNTSNTFVNTGSYNVSLIATSSFGCTDTAIKVVDALEPHIDVAVQNVTAVINNNFLTITAQIVNKGTVDVTSLVLTVRLNDGTIIQENWTGLLLRGGVILDTISSTIYLKDTKRFVCVSAVKPNNLDDENPSDNESCIAADKSSFEVLQPYPVPAGESIALAVLIPNSTGNLEVNICNARGQTLRAIYSGIIAEGLQLFTVNLTDVAKGFYAFTVTYEGKTVVKKFIID